MKKPTDRQRMDWLSKGLNGNLIRHTEPVCGDMWVVRKSLDHEYHKQRIKTLRQAIDAAMKLQEKAAKL